MWHTPFPSLLYKQKKKKITTKRRSEIDNFKSTENLPFFPVCLFKVHVMAMHLSLLSTRVGGEQATHGKLTHRAFLWVGTLTLRCFPRVRNLTLPPSSKMERTWKWVSTMGVKSAQEKIQMVAKNIPWIQHDTCSMWYHQTCAKESWPPSLCLADDVTFLGETVVHVLPLINTIWKLFNKASTIIKVCLWQK